MSKHTGGGKFGRVNNSWPFVKLEVSGGGVSLRTILQEVHIKRESIQDVIHRRSFINHRFIFRHNDPSVKELIEFWTFSPGPVAEDLRSQGYPVSEG